MATTEKKAKTVHGVDEAYYANTPNGLRAVLRCLCGEEFDGGTSAWSDAGYALDQHLDESTEAGEL